MVVYINRTIIEGIFSCRGQAAGRMRSTSSHSALTSASHIVRPISASRKPPRPATPAGPAPTGRSPGPPPSRPGFPAARPCAWAGVHRVLDEALQGLQHHRLFARPAAVAQGAAADLPVPCGRRCTGVGRQQPASLPGLEEGRRRDGVARLRTRRARLWPAPAGRVVRGGLARPVPDLAARSVVDHLRGGGLSTIARFAVRPDRPGSLQFDPNQDGRTTNFRSSGSGAPG